MGQIHNELRRAARIANAVKAILGDTDSDNGLERFSETLQPVVNLWDRIEWATLAGEVPWWDTAVKAAVVARFSTILVINPANSGLIITVSGFSYNNHATGIQVVGSLTGGAGAGAGTVVSTFADARDRRVGSSQSTPVVIRTSDEVADLVTRSHGLDQVGANDGLMVPIPVVLDPNSNFVIGCSVANVGFSASLFGTVRRAFPDELKHPITV